MIFFLNKQQFNKVISELNVHSNVNIPKWTGSTKVRNIFKSLLSKVEFNGSIIDKQGNIISQADNSNYFAIKIEYDDIDELIHDSSQNYVNFWRVFSSFVIIKEDDNSNTNIQSKIVCNFLNKVHCEVFDEHMDFKTIEMILDYLYLKFQFKEYNNYTLSKILVGNNKRFKSTKLYGKWPGKNPEKYAEFFTSVELWLNCNNLLDTNSIEYLKNDDHRSDISSYDLAVDFIANLDLGEISYFGESLSLTKLAVVISEYFFTIKDSILSKTEPSTHSANKLNASIIDELSNNILCVTKIRKFQTEEGNHCVKILLPMIFHPVNKTFKNLQIELILLLKPDYSVISIHTEYIQTDNIIITVNNKLKGNP